MATYTIIETSRLRNRSEVVIEFDVPSSGVNAAGVQWRDIYAETRSFGGNEGTSVNPRKFGSAAHLNKLDSGAVVEIPLSVEYNADLPDADKELVIDAAAAARVANFEADFQEIYRFYGVERTV